MREVIKRSRRCLQPGRLPNLQVKRIIRRDNGRYHVRVANEGRDVATGASVQLFVDDFDAGMVALPDLDPGQARWSAGFEAPDCLGPIQAVVDPTHVVRESAEDDNALTESCLNLTPR